MKLNDQVYDCIKWICLIAIPAFSVCWTALSNVWNWPYAEQISQTANILCTLLGTMIGISTATYNKEQNAENLDNFTI